MIGAPLAPDATALSRGFSRAVAQRLLDLAQRGGHLEVPSGSSCAMRAAAICSTSSWFCARSLSFSSRRAARSGSSRSAGASVIRDS